METSKRAVASYLKSHKATGVRQTDRCGIQSSSSQLQTSRKKSVEYVSQRMSSLRVSRSKGCIDSLPDELLLRLFRYVTPASLAQCSCVCKRWQTLANDNLIWSAIYRCFLGTPKPDQVPSDPTTVPLGYWKQQCLTRSSVLRNKRADWLLKAVHPYSGLPKNTNKILREFCVKWQLSIMDSDDHDHVLHQSDVIYHSMSVVIRWYPAADWIPVRSVKAIKIYAVSPLFFDKAVGKAIRHSPCQCSLMLVLSGRLDKLLADAVCTGEDGLVSVYQLNHGIMVATWKDGGELAFVSVNMHAHQLIQRCVHGTRNRCANITIPKPLPDDIDPQYGLHDYSCTLELRNQKQTLWSQQFRGSDAVYQRSHAVLTLISPDSQTQHSLVNRKPQLPWRTELFKGIVQDVCILDGTILDERHKPFWCISSLVSISRQNSAQSMDFDYTRGDKRYITYSDSKGQVLIQFDWSSDTEQYYVTLIQLRLALSAINDWFSTKYM